MDLGTGIALVTLSTTVFHAWLIYVLYMWLVNCECV